MRESAGHQHLYSFREHGRGTILGVTGDAHRDLLDRATAALEGIERTIARQAESFERQNESFDRMTARFDRQNEAFDRMTRRWELSENLFLAAISEISASVQRNTERLDDMGEAIRANTRAVLSVLDRLGPAPG